LKVVDLVVGIDLKSWIFQPFLQRSSDLIEPVRREAASLLRLQ
jgi:hypothetical protein